MMRLLWGRKYLLILISISLIFFIMLQFYLFSEKHFSNFKFKDLKHTSVQYYEILDNAAQKNAPLLQQDISEYHGFNSCLVSSNVNYRTLDFYEMVNANHRKNIETEDQIPEWKQLQFLEAIIVPHSHNDPGWINTFQGHYEEQSRYILSNMVAKMTKYKKMTFVWAEMVLLSKWWGEISEGERNQTRQLIKEGRLEILGGGWVVPDEATTHYSALVNNFLEGHLWLKKHLNFTPTTSWSLDPFGYSAFLPHLYKRMHLQNAILLRVHTEVKQLMVAEKLLHFKWRPVWSSSGDVEDGSNDMNAFMLPYRLYNIKFQCGPDTEVCLQFDFRQIAGEFSESVALPVSESNVYQLTSLLTEQLRKKASLQRNNQVVLFPLGDDFRFDRAQEWDQQYVNFMKLMQFINSRSDLFNMTIRFGTVRDFFDVLNREKDDSSKLPTLSGDFFPYSDNPNDYWTGYYTSRIWLKKSIRMLESLIHAAEIIHLKTLFLSLESNKDLGAYVEAIEEVLSHVRSNVSLLQHHDAITGTSTESATLDFFKRATDSLADTELIIRQSFVQAINSLKTSKESREYIQFKILSETLSHNNRKFLLVGAQSIDVILFNPLITTYVNPSNIRVESDKDLSSTVEEYYLRVERYHLEADGLVMKPIECVVQKNDIGKRTYSLHFNDNLAPFSYQIYKISVSNNRNDSCQLEEDYNHETKKSNDLSNSSSKQIQHQLENTPKMESKEYVLNSRCSTFYFNKITGHLSRIQSPGHPIQTVDVGFYIYTANGDGPYLFRPYKPAVEFWSEEPNRVKVTRSRLYHWVEVRVDELLRVKYRVAVGGTCSGGASIDVEVTSDMKEKHQNQEIVMRVVTNIKSGFLFFTDSNAFNPMLRKRMASLGIAANYYPATSYAFIETSERVDAMRKKAMDEGVKVNSKDNYRLSVLMSEPHGVSSLSPGDLEVMLDRMTSYDDGKGVGGGISDNRMITANFKLLLDRFERGNDAETLHNGNINSTDTSMRHPSLDAHLVVDQMRHKPVVAATTSLSPSLISELLTRDLSIDASKVPCDVSLTATRHLHNYVEGPRDHQQMATYLALHRFSWQAGFHMTSFHHLHELYGCKLTSIASKVTAPTPLSGVQYFTNCDLVIADLFPASQKITSAYSTSLTLLHRHQNVDAHTKTCLNASSLNAYLILSKPHPQTIP